MASDESEKLATQVVDMTVMGRVGATATFNGKPDPVRAAEIRERMRAEQIAKYSQHFDTEQLRAIIEFYSTEMGRSILDSHERMAADIHSGIKLVSGSFPDPVKK